jgi:predicted enzyme related to lactoylglutathione lyase
MPDTGDMYKTGDVILYIGSEDVAADLTQIEQAGGKKLSDPFKVGDFGEMAFFADPTGNRLALWKELQPGGQQ